MQVASTNFYGLEDQRLTDSEISRLVIGNISVNSTAFLDFSDPKKVAALGNPTEGALLLWLNNSKILYSNIPVSYTHLFLPVMQMNLHINRHLIIGL